MAFCVQSHIFNLYALYIPVHHIIFTLKKIQLQQFLRQFISSCVNKAFEIHATPWPTCMTSLWISSSFFFLVDIIHLLENPKKLYAIITKSTQPPCMSLHELPVLRVWECAQFDIVIYGQFSINTCRWKKALVYISCRIGRILSSVCPAVWSWLKKTGQATV